MLLTYIIQIYNVQNENLDQVLFRQETDYSLIQPTAFIRLDYIFRNKYIMKLIMRVTLSALCSE